MRLLSLPWALALLLPAACLADDVILQRVLVEGARSGLLGIADAASAGSIGQRDLAARAVYRPGELLEATPGLVVSQHSGEGKANQFYLRGFNLDHGTDLATFVDGMPVNQRSHAHGQGWTDLNFLIPEIAARLDYTKGPYSARMGDFSSAGSASITYANRLVQDVASVSVGQNGYVRSVLAGSPAAGQGGLLYAVEVLHNDGPFTRPDDYRKLNAVLRYSQGYANNGWSVSAMAYRGIWSASDQIPERAVGSGALQRFDAVDATDGGAARRLSLSGVWRRTGSGAASRVNAYVIRNQLDLFSNFTYYLDDPVNGDQFSQPDRRVTAGLDAQHAWHVHRGETVASDLSVGLVAQNDNIFNGLYSTRARQRIALRRQDHIVESSAGAWIENATRWRPWLRTVVGLRADAYRFEVGSGRTRDTLASPSLGIALGPWSRTEFYFNAGDGFHSNDARGNVAHGQGLVRSRGMEVGMRSEAIPKVQATLSLYRLDFDSELTFLGDEGSTVAGPPSRRYGVEISSYYKPVKWLSLDVDAAFARARWRGVVPAASHIPGAVEGVGQLALTVDRQGPWSGSLRLRYFGPRPLTDDNSIRSHPSLTLNGRIGYRLRSGLRLELEGFNLTKRRDAAVEYYYESRLQHEAGPRADRHFHPIEPRTARITLVKTW